MQGKCQSFIKFCLFYAGVTVDEKPDSLSMKKNKKKVKQKVLFSTGINFM